MADKYDMIKYYFNMFGLQIDEKWDPTDRRKVWYTLYIPELDTEGNFVSFLRDQCRPVALHTFADVRRYINVGIGREKLKEFAAAMDKLNKEWEAKKGKKDEV